MRTPATRVLAPLTALALAALLAPVTTAQSRKATPAQAVDAEYTANVQARIAKVLQDARDAALEGDDYDLGEHLTPLFDEFYSQIVQPILTEAVGNCDAAEANMSTALLTADSPSSYRRTASK